MRIAYIANIRLPTEKAHGIQIMKMCEAFANLDHEVELIVPNRKSGIKEDPFFYYEVKKNFKITKIWCVDTVRFGFLGFLLEWLIFAESIFWRELFQKRDIYYGRDYLSLLYLSIFSKNTAWETHTGEWNFFVKLYCKTSKKIVAISQGLKDFYTEKGVSPEKIIVAHDGVDSEHFNVTITKEEAKEKLGIKTNLPVVMYIGALGLWKGVDTLLEASEFFKEKAQVVIIGGSEKEVGSLREKYKGVIFLGYRPYKELPVNQKAADVLVVPNTGKDKISVKYTSPLKIFAHMASGVPIVASDLPSIREILNEENAYFAEADNAKSFAEIIMMVLLNKQEAQKRSLNAIRDTEEYTWLNRAKNISSFILN